MEAERLELVRCWLRKAEHDLKNARIVLESAEEGKPFDTICFHCQQAAEKSLKGYCVYLDVMFTRTHSIGQLGEQGCALDPGLGTFASVEELSPYGVDIRYPDDFYLPTEQEAKDAFAAAMAVFLYVQGNTGTANGQ